MKKIDLKNYLGLIALFLSFTFSGITFSQSTITIGSGTSSTNNTPFNGYYDNSWSSVIYLSNEINATGNLSSLAFYVDNAPANYNMVNQKIYVRTTTATSYTSSNYPTTEGFTLIYDGPISYTTAGWKTLNTMFPFSYDGTSNLEFLFENRDGSWANGFPYFRYTSTGTTSRTKRDFQDTQFPSACYVCEKYAYVPNIQMTFQACPFVAGTVTSDKSTTVPGTDVKLSLSGNSAGTTIQWQFSYDNINFINATNATTNEYTHTLNADTYFRALVSSNGCSKATPVVTITSDVSTMTTKTIGTGTYASRNYPLNEYYNYSWSSIIYKASDIGSEGLIGRIALSVANAPNNITMPNQKIYIRHTQTSSFADANYPGTTGFTLVYDGPINFNGAGWKEIIFNNLFYFNGTDNVEILFENRSGKYTLDYPTFFGTSGDQTDYRVKRDYADANFPSSCTTCGRFLNSVNIQFKLFPCNVVAGTIAASNVNLCSGNTTSLTLSGQTSGGTIQWQSSSDNVTFTNISAATANTYTTSALSANTFYRVVVTKGGCTKNSGSLKINVSSLVAGTGSSSNSSICNGNTTTLTLAGNTTGSTFTWHKSTDNVTYSEVPNSANSLTCSTGVLTQNTYYKAIVTDGICTKETTPVQITIQNVNAGVISTLNEIVAYNQSATISITEQQSGAMIQWQQSTDNVNFTDISGATSTKLITTGIVDLIYFRAVVKYNGCTVNTNVLTLNVDQSIFSNVEIGTGTDKYNNYPFNGYFNNSWASILYKASEINSNGKLASISFYVDNAPVNYTMNNQKIYVRHTKVSEFENADYPTTTGFTLVFDGSITYNGSGWKQFVFNTPFEYNGVDDLEFLFENKDGSWATGYPIFRGQSYVSEVRVKRDYSDLSFPSNCTYCKAFNNLLNVKMKFIKCENAPSTLVASKTSARKGDQIAFELTQMPVEGPIEWYVSNDNFDFTKVEGATTSTYSTTMNESPLYVKANVTKTCSTVSNTATVSMDNCFAKVATTGAGTLSTEKYPLNQYYDYSWSSTIYTPQEIGGAGKIVSIAFDIANNPNNYVGHHQKIYARHTTTTEYTDGNYPNNTEFTLVYDGTIHFNGTGWKEIAFNTPFEYNGTDNIEFLYENYDNSWGMDYPKFKYTSGSTTYRTKRDYQDDNFPSTCVNCARNLNVPNLKVRFETPTNLAGVVSAGKEEICQGETLTLTYSGLNDIGTTYQWSRSSDNVNFRDIESAINVSYTINNFYEPAFYRVKATLNGCSVFSKEINIIKCTSKDNYDEEKGRGDITIDITNIADKVGPYNYVISREPILDISELYQYMKDSVFTDSTYIDSVTFYRGNNSSLTYFETDLLIGTYYMKVFDSRGKTILNKEILLSPSINLLESQYATLESKNKIVLNQNGVASFDKYFLDWTEKELTFELNTNVNQFMGLMDNSIITLSQDNLQYGFKITDQLIEVYHEGLVIKSGINVPLNSKLKISQNNGEFEYYLNDELLISKLAPSTYTLKGTVGNKSLEELRIVIRDFERFRRPTFEGFPTSCLGNSGSIIVNFNVNIESKPLPSQVYNVVLTDSEGNTYNAQNGNSGSYFNFTNLTAGTYVLSYSNGSTNQTVNIEVPTYLNWTNLVNETVNFNTHSITNNHSYQQGRAESSNEMDANSSNNFNYYVEFNLNVSKSTLWMFTLYKNTDIYAGFQNNYNANAMFLFKKAMKFTKQGLSISQIQYNNVFLKNCDFTKRYKIQYNPSTGIMKLFERNTFGTQYFVSASYTQIGPDRNIGPNVSEFELLSKLTNAGLINVTTNIFCKPTLLYAKLERNLKGVNYKPIKNKVYFKFEEEYTGNTQLQFKVLNDKNQKVLDPQNNVLIKQQGTTTSNEYGDNRYELSVVSLSSGTYTLEVINDKKEKFYLRFTKE